MKTTHSTPNKIRLVSAKFSSFVAPLLRSCGDIKRLQPQFATRGVSSQWLVGGSYARNHVLITIVMRPSQSCHSPQLRSTARLSVSSSGGGLFNGGLTDSMSVGPSFLQEAIGSCRRKLFSRGLG